jgi:hypothetical protein
MFFYVFNEPLSGVLTWHDTLHGFWRFLAQIILDFVATEGGYTSSCN